MDNRKGLVAAAKVVPATGTTERDTAIEMLAELQSRGQVTLGADKAYDTHEFVERLRDLNVTPHVAQNHKRRWLCHRCSHDPPSGLRGEPAYPQTH